MDISRDILLNNIFSQWTKCKNNHIYLENISDKQLYFLKKNIILSIIMILCV